MRALVPAGLNRKEAEIFSRLDPERLPHHIAIIMDGNGRWAKRRHLPRVAGHRSGVAAVRSTIETAARIHIPALTLYSFSAENWKRPKSEVSYLMNLLRRYLKMELSTMMDNNIRLQYIGRQHELPQEVQERMSWAREATEKNTGMVLTLALNYSSRVELVDCFNDEIVALGEVKEDHAMRHANALGNVGGLGLPDSVPREQFDGCLDNLLSSGCFLLLSCRGKHGSQVE